MKIHLQGLACAVVMSGCNTQNASAPPPLPPPPAEQVTWQGHPPSRFQTDSTGATRIHTLEFMGQDTVRLRLTESAGEVPAFQAFQALAGTEEIRQGFYRDRNRLIFQHGAYIGELQPSGGGMLPTAFLKENLGLRGEPLFRKPETFRTFPLAGQIEGSERIWTPEYLGSRVKDPLPSMAYECHQDTARLFRGQPPYSLDPLAWLDGASGVVDTLDWGRERRFSGTLPDGNPLILWVFRGATVGVWGCYDDQLAQQYAEKLKKTAILWENP